MAKLTIKGQEYLLNVGFKAGTAKAGFYVGLATDSTDLTESTTTVTEPTDTAYGRRQITFGALTQEGSPTKTTIKNSADLNIGTWVANASVAITHVIITDNATKGSGEILAYYKLPTAISPTAGQPVSIKLGGLSLGLD